MEYVLSRELKDCFHRRVLVLTDGEVWNTDHVISVAETLGKIGRSWDGDDGFGRRIPDPHGLGAVQSVKARDDMKW